MPKCVPANLANAGTHCRRFDLPLENALLPARFPNSVGKHPVRRFTALATVPLFEESIAQTRIDGKGKPRSFRLCVADSAVNDASPDQERALFPIQITPLQPYDFAGPGDRDMQLLEPLCGRALQAPLEPGESRVRSAPGVSIDARRAAVPTRLD
jgi:hypothetical protein